jgi:NDP-sugar pyrophosphorylase family protein
MHSVKKAIVLAGGKGSRLHPVTMEIPKPLIPIKKRPLINYNLDLFWKYGVKDVKIIIRPSDRLDYERWLREHCTTFSGMAIELAEEPEPMGTLGFLFHHLRAWMGDEDVFVSNGDDIKDIDLAAMAAFHRRMGLPATEALILEKERKDGGFALVRENRIMDFLEKDAALDTEFISAGMHLVSSKALDGVIRAGRHDKKYLMFEVDLFPVLAKEGNLAGFVYNGKLFDCGTFERWERAIREV